MGCGRGGSRSSRRSQCRCGRRGIRALILLTFFTNHNKHAAGVDLIAFIHQHGKHITGCKAFHRKDSLIRLRLD